MRRFNTPLYWRLLVWFCAANLLVLVLGGLLAQRYIAHATTVKFNWAALASQANQTFQTGGQGALGAWVAQQRQRGIEATLFERERPLYPITLPQKLHPQLRAWLASGQSVVRQPWPGFYVAVQQVTGSDGRSLQLLAMSHRHLREHTRVSIFLAIQLLLSLLFIGLVGWWVARSVARPVENLRRAARRMAAGELSVRIGRQGGLAHDELSRLAGDFDVMAERIEALVAHDRRVLQDLSHELRSPLARLHLILDLAGRSKGPAAAAPYFEQAEQEIVGLDRMLGEMLALSRMEGGMPGMDRESLDLADVVRSCLRRAHLEADSRMIELRLTGNDSAVVSGSALLLERALDNLLANAIKFSPDGGLVEVTLLENPPFAELWLRDHGPGVPAGELSLLFQPFFRGSNAKRADGHGLGLAIVQRVVHAHGGNIDIRNADGGGLEIQLRLPLACFLLHAVQEVLG